jgi:hypothetical protein
MYLATRLDRRAAQVKPHLEESGRGARAAAGEFEQQLDAGFPAGASDTLRGLLTESRVVLLRVGVPRVAKLLEILPVSAAIVAVVIFPIYRLLLLPLAASVGHRVSARTRWKNFGLACAYVAVCGAPHQTADERTRPPRGRRSQHYRATGSNGNTGSTSKAVAAFEPAAG